jgi:hypothetical protein
MIGALALPRIVLLAGISAPSPTAGHYIPIQGFQSIIVLSAISVLALRSPTIDPFRRFQRIINFLLAGLRARHRVPCTPKRISQLLTTASMFGFGTGDIAGILPPGCAGGACIVNGILVTPQSNGQFGGCSEGSGYYFYCIEFAPAPSSTGPLLTGPGPNVIGPAPTASNLAHTAVAGAVSLPISPGVVFAIPFAWIPSTSTICLGLGGGLGSPGFNVGVVHSSQNIQNVLSGPSVSVAGQSGLWGAQWVHNTSGIAAGNSMGTPGVSLTVTGSACF